MIIYIYMFHHHMIIIIIMFMLFIYLLFIYVIMIDFLEIFIVAPILIVITHMFRKTTYLET